MRKALLSVVASWLMVSAMLAPRPVSLQAEGKKSPPPDLKVGDMAPDFKLPYVDASGEKEVTLSQYRGKKNVVLAFYVFAFTGG